jgi:hypothetical protein
MQSPIWQGKGWSDLETQSCAHWLNWKCGIDAGAAREKVRVAHALEELPRISAAMDYDLAISVLMQQAGRTSSVAVE